MSNPIRDKRLGFELERMKLLCEESSMIAFQATPPELPDQYLVEFRCVGLVNRNTRQSRHLVTIYLPADYPRTPPIVRFKSPIFHPNIKGLLNDTEQMERLINSLGGVENLMELYSKDENIREAFDAHICLDVLQLNWSPSYDLYDICVELAGMIQYQRYNLDDPLNQDANEWAKLAKEQGVLPIDPRIFRDRVKFMPTPLGGKPSIRVIKTEIISK